MTPSDSEAPVAPLPTNPAAPTAPSHDDGAASLPAHPERPVETENAASTDQPRNPSNLGEQELTPPGASADQASQVMACPPPNPVHVANQQEPTPSADQTTQALACPPPAVASGVTGHEMAQIGQVPNDLMTRGPATAAAKGFWDRLPCELLLAIVEASPCPLHTYIQLLGLSHATRQGIRGTLHELSFPEPDLALAPTITADALAAIVGPCKALRKLSLPNLVGMEAVFPSSAGNRVDEPYWVDEAFGGHTQLAVLAAFPSWDEHDIERILGHLPGLVELTAASWRFPISTELLAALAHSCPGLQVLRCSLSIDSAEPDFTALAPLSGVLKVLDIQGDPSCEESLAALVPTLSALTSLRLPCRCPPAAFEPIASHLTSLELGGGDTLEDEDLPGPWLCRLEALSMGVSPNFHLASLARLLTTNQATLRSLSLSQAICQPVDPEVLSTSLRALPRLTHLTLDMVNTGCQLSALLSPNLVDRLERLDLDYADPIERITSSHLQYLCLNVIRAGALTLDCPALVELDMTERHRPLTSLASLQCPRLRTLKVPVKCLSGMTTVPMPDLEVAEFRGKQPVKDPAWLLAGSPSPRLRVLSFVRLTQPDLLASLCACGSLVRLEKLHLDATRLPNPLVLRLPGQLEQLDLRIDGGRSPDEDDDPVDLLVEAPGLLDFTLGIPGKSTLPSVRVRLRDCPRLVRLDFQSPAVPISIQVDEEAGAGAPVMQPRFLMVKRLDAASLLGLLTRHGARLRKVTAEGLQAVRRDWPQLMEALSGLPRLTRLDLDVYGASSPLSLTCPQLRTLSLHHLPDETKVVLACPLLGETRGIGDPSRQLEVALRDGIEGQVAHFPLGAFGESSSSILSHPPPVPPCAKLPIFFVLGHMPESLNHL
ncbi:hypothetical protein PAPYR_545 [Paratrimastix pyriformis]|uniref:Uncharacterized protein n=1 Tax=Paratrimastix pyriformis TaxID=342808 RepID=A0ABQ8UTV6_9EUKA|nr:hypothetical protein PAPYR_545 [Paratrimastix pyriformis]